MLNIFLLVYQKCVPHMQGNGLSKTLFSQIFWLLCKFRNLAKIFLQVCQKSIQHAQRLHLTKLFRIGKPTNLPSKYSFLANTFQFLARMFEHVCQSCFLPKEKNLLNARYFGWKFLFRNNFMFLANTFRLVCQKSISSLQVYGRGCQHCTERVQRNVLRKIMFLEIIQKSSVSGILENNFWQVRQNCILDVRKNVLKRRFFLQETLNS